MKRLKTILVAAFILIYGGNVNAQALSLFGRDSDAAGTTNKLGSLGGREGDLTGGSWTNFNGNTLLGDDNPVPLGNATALLLFLGGSYLILKTKNRKSVK
jgi:hypothetical protein